VMVFPPSMSAQRSLAVKSLPSKEPFVFPTRSSPSQLRVVLNSLSPMWLTLSLPSVVYAMSYLVSPVPPVWTTLILILGSSCVTFSVMLSGGGIGPNSVFEALSFQSPLKSDLATAGIVPTTAMRTINVKNLYMRIVCLLLFIENHLHIRLAHGADQ